MQSLAGTWIVVHGTIYVEESPIRAAVGQSEWTFCSIRCFRNWCCSIFSIKDYPTTDYAEAIMKDLPKPWKEKK